ncbi:MAG: hypothetical protein Q9219_005722 [cf. Caloplaca sp. 3 TL-2023]
MSSKVAATETGFSRDAGVPTYPNKAPVVCVFCGASPGNSPAHLEAARSLGQALHKHKISLVYGGGSGGLMGEVAKTLVGLSGPSAVHGIIPKTLLGLERKGAQDFDESVYGRTTVVSDMHARKEMMAREVTQGGPGSGFVALTGGYGTMEELMEMVTWNQLGIHGQGLVVFNVEGYYDGLMSWVRTAVGAGFITAKNEKILVEASTAEEVVKALKEYKVSEDRLQLNWKDD